MLNQIRVHLLRDLWLSESLEALAERGLAAREHRRGAERVRAGVRFRAAPGPGRESQMGSRFQTQPQTPDRRDQTSTWCAVLPNDTSCRCGCARPSSPGVA